MLRLLQVKNAIRKEVSLSHIKVQKKKKNANPLVSLNYTLESNSANMSFCYCRQSASQHEGRTNKRQNRHRQESALDGTYKVRFGGTRVLQVTGSFSLRLGLLTHLITPMLNVQVEGFPLNFLL